ncbi:MAG: DUF3592 domain-containing protein [Clostridia bacterium]|nr:DUF3592 domain-containing protein [Clostridia bacterium]
MNMEENAKKDRSRLRLIAALLLALTMLWVGASAGDASLSRRLAREGVRVEGTITSYKHRTRNEIYDRYTTYVTYTYRGKTYADKPYESWDYIPTGGFVGRKVYVIVDPKNPKTYATSVDEDAEMSTFEVVVASLMAGIHVAIFIMVGNSVHRVKVQKAIYADRVLTLDKLRQDLSKTSVWTAKSAAEGVAFCSAELLVIWALECGMLRWDVPVIAIVAPSLVGVAVAAVAVKMASRKLGCVTIQTLERTDIIYKTDSKGNRTELWKLGDEITWYPNDHTGISLEDDPLYQLRCSRYFHVGFESVNEDKCIVRVFSADEFTYQDEGNAEIG